MSNVESFFISSTTKREKNGGGIKEQSELKGKKQHHLLGLEGKIKTEKETEEGGIKERKQKVC